MTRPAQPGPLGPPIMLDLTETRLGQKSVKDILIILELNEQNQITQGHNVWLNCILPQSPNSLNLFVLHGQELNIYFMHFPAECGFWLAIHGLLKAV